LITKIIAILDPMKPKDYAIILSQKLIFLFKNKSFVLFIWFGLSLFPVISEVLQPKAVYSHYNNYIIYKHTFLNLVQQHSLFGPQPVYYFDLNHYGPVFAIIIAPFTLLRDNIAVILWVIFNSWILYLAIMKLPLNESKRLAILLISAPCIMASAQNVQVNPLIAALVIFSYVFIRNKQDFWAALVIIIGTAVKLYGIVGLAFFFFSDNKIKLILSMIFWSAILFVLPMLFSSPSYVIKIYHDWYPDLIAKNAENIASNRTYICVMGMISKVFKIPNVSNILVLGPALILFALTYLRIKVWKNPQYQLLVLASVLIFTVIFSSGSEPPTYVIDCVGIGIWFVNLDRPLTRFEIFLIIFAVYVTNAPSDVFPRYLRIKYVMPFELIALPSFIVWLKIIYELFTRKFDSPASKQTNTPVLENLFGVVTVSN
jgi:hypothetical protein